VAQDKVYLKTLVNAAMRAKLNVVSVVLLNTCIQHFLDMMRCRLVFVDVSETFLSLYLRHK
jgi:hypothetical protein